MIPVYIDASPFMMTELEGLLPDHHDRMAVNVGDPDPDGVVALAEQAEVILNGHTVMDAALLDRLPHLRRIVFLGSGASSYIDLSAAEARGIEVATVQGYGDRSVAEMAAALMFAAARQVAAMDRAIRAGTWAPLEGLELRGRTLGILGFGGIGREFASIGRALGMEVAIWNRSPLTSEWASCQMPLEEVLSSSDVLSLHMALTSETKGILSADAFAQMKQGAILINTARAALVERGALIRALDDRRLSHAALDVFDAEPLTADDPVPLRADVTLTAHAGFKTPDAARRLMSEGLRLALAPTHVIA